MGQQLLAKILQSRCTTERQAPAGSALQVTAYCESSLMLNWNGILMETCKNNLKTIEFKDMEHLECSLETSEQGYKEG